MRLEQIRRVDRTLARTCTDNRVQLVDEQNDPPLGLGHFLEKGLQAILKLTAVLRSGKHAAKVHHNDALVLHRVRHIAGNNPPRETFDNRCLAHARFTNQHRIVLRSARKHLQHAPNLMIASDHRINLARPRASGEVGAVFFQRLVFTLGIFIGHFLRPANILHRITRLLFIESGLLEQFARGRITLQRSEQEMLNTQKLIAERLAHLIGRIERRTKPDAYLWLRRCPLHARLAAQGVGNRRLQRRDVDSGLLQDRHRDAALLLQQGQQHMRAFEFRMSRFRSDPLRGLQGFLEFAGDFLKSHGCIL